MFYRDVIIHLNFKFNSGLTTVEVRAGTSNYIALFYLNVMTYPRLNQGADLANLCY